MLELVDSRKIGINPAYELSFLHPEEQQNLLKAMDEEQATPSLSQAQRLKRFSQDGKLSGDVMSAILSEQKKPTLEHITLDSETLRRYFPKEYTPRQMQDTILKLLDQWQRRRRQDHER